MNQRIALVIGAIVVLAVGILVGRDLQRSEQRANSPSLGVGTTVTTNAGRSDGSQQQATPTIRLGPNYGPEKSCAEGGCTVYGPCPNDVPPVSHWECTGSITQEEFDTYIKPQLDAQAREDTREAIRLWAEQTGGHLAPEEAESSYCSILLDDSRTADLHSECMEKLTGIVGE
jgi:hypothetical protein